MLACVVISIVCLVLMTAAECADYPALSDALVGDSVVVNGKQLFIDDHLVAELDGVKRILQRPVKHDGNPIIVPDRPGEKVFNRGSVLYDRGERLFKMWYIVYDDKLQNQLLAYATSQDGVHWTKPAVDPDTGSNLIPNFQAANPPCITKDDVDPDPARRYKMLFGELAAGRNDAYVTSAAYSPDGLHWTREPENPLIPHSDTLSCPFWDASRNRYVAFVRYGPPNVRIVSRIESEDFVRWSSKVTVLRPGAMDRPFATQFYGMNVSPYAGVYLGLITAYHGETLKPIPADELWRDRKNVHLAYSRNGLTWSRVGGDGVVDLAQQRTEAEWRDIAERAVLIPNGDWPSAWDAGVIYPFHAPIIVGDEIFIYYYAHNGRNWWNHHGDDVKHGIGLAKLRLDGFMALTAENEGTVTTRPMVFIGDTLVVNANAAGGSIRVEALDVSGQTIPGFSRDDSIPTETDAVDHALAWRNQPRCGALEARPIRLRFYLKDASLYSLEPRIRFKRISRSE